MIPAELVVRLRWIERCDVRSEAEAIRDYARQAADEITRLEAVNEELVKTCREVTNDGCMCCKCAAIRAALAKAAPATQEPRAADASEPSDP